MFLVPLGVPKDVLTRDDHTPSPDCTDLNQGVPVNLTYNLIRKQQTVKFKSVSGGFPNHSYVGYRQGPADSEGDKRLYKVNV